MRSPSAGEARALLHGVVSVAMLEASGRSKQEAKIFILFIILSLPPCISAIIFAKFNHCLGTKINNNIINVNILIVIVKELDRAIL